MNIFQNKLAVAALALAAIVSVMAISCNKNSAGKPDNSIRHSITSNARIFTSTSSPGGLWYLGTPYPGGCGQPCGNYCHSEPWNRTYNPQEAGPAYYTLLDNGQLVVEVDITNMDPQHLDQMVATGTFSVATTTELPYQSIVEAYNNAGITSNIPHYKMPQGLHQIALNNTGTSVKVLAVTFTSTNTIDVSLEY